MKYLSIACALTVAAFTFSSCDKAAALLFKPFESPLNFNVTIPVVSSTTAESTLGSSTVAFDLDQEISKNTGGELDSKVVGAMYINAVAFTLTNADGSNNLSNFEYVTLSVSSGNSTPVVLGPFTISAGSTTAQSFTVANSPDVKQFFSGKNVQFELRGKAKAATTKALNATIAATIKFDK